MSIEKLLSISKPILHELDHEETPYAGIGTCFLAKYKNSGFLITAKHLLEGEEAESLMIFPNNQTEVSIPFNQFVNINDTNTYDSDYGDITILCIDYSQLHIAENSDMNVLDMDKYENNWKRHKDNNKIIFFGYPKERRIINYEKYIIKSDQRLIYGKYLGASISNYCHEINITDYGDVEDLDGFSGSPIFVLEKKQNEKLKPYFCGMLIRGTLSSKKATFIDSNVIYEIIKNI